MDQGKPPDNKETRATPPHKNKKSLASRIFPFLRRTSSSNSTETPSATPSGLQSVASSRRSSDAGHRNQPSGLFSSLGRRLRRRTWAGSRELDPETAERLREFYIRNRDATRRDAKELERRATFWERLQEPSLIETDSSSASIEDHRASASPKARRTIGGLNLKDLEALLHEIESEEPPSPEESPTTRSPGAPYYRSPSPSGRKVLFRAGSSIKPAEESLEACAALQGYARSKESSAEELIQPYDIFSPDVRSTRWNEFCQVLQRDRTDFDQYLRGVEAVRGSDRAVTVAGIRPGRPSPY